MEHSQRVGDYPKGEQPSLASALRPITEKGEGSGDSKATKRFEIFGSSLQQGCSVVPRIAQPQNSLRNQKRTS